MSANIVTETIVTEINVHTPDFICLNFANADMVGHTGVWPAIIEAVEVVNKCVEEVVTAALEKDYAVLLTADHGNADYAVNEDGSPNTAHTVNLVPLFFLDKNLKPQLSSGKLGDIAPTILQLMDIDVPAEMTGNNLLT
jgi:2,3-bisphosphoglycerate-independent phosphoglycerate mutase